MVQEDNTQGEKCKAIKSTRTHDEKLGPNISQIKYQLKKTKVYILYLCEVPHFLMLSSTIEHD